VTNALHTMAPHRNHNANRVVLLWGGGARLHGIKKKGLNVTNTPRNPYANLNYDWEGNDEWYGHWWPKQDEVLEDIRKAIERSKQLNSNTTQEGVVNATAQ
jgi:hypothetical protein